MSIYQNDLKDSNRKIKIFLSLDSHLFHSANFFIVFQVNSMLCFHVILKISPFTFNKEESVK